VPGPTGEGEKARGQSNGPIEWRFGQKRVRGPRTHEEGKSNQTSEVTNVATVSWGEKPRRKKTVSIGVVGRA